MLLIPCPWCGPRDEIEFRYGGEAHIARPADPDALDERPGPTTCSCAPTRRGSSPSAGSTQHGCRRWFNLLRDTVSHRILPAYRIGDEPPLDLSRNYSGRSPGRADRLGETLQIEIKRLGFHDNADRAGDVAGLLAGQLVARTASGSSAPTPATRFA